MYAPLDPTADAEKTEVLASDAISNWLQTYTYSDIGNLTNKSDVGNYTYGNTGYANPHAATTINGTTYSYDNAGNLTSAGSAAYAWDYANRLTDTNANGTTTHYLYDQSGQRVRQDVNTGTGTTTTTYWNKLYETRGATTTLYLFLPNGELLGTIEGNGTATSTFITHTDHLGGTNVVTDKNGNQTQLATYYPYGTKRNNELPANFRESRLFIGQYDDLATSLSYLNARYYDATRGQFLSEDPVFNRDPNKQQLIDPQSFNSYSYALNNPLKYSDPNGENPIFVAILLRLVSALQTLSRILSTPTALTAISTTAAITNPTTVHAPTQTTNLSIPTAMSTPQVIFGVAEMVGGGGAAKSTVNVIEKKGWQLGDDVYKNTAKGKFPSWSTVRARFWKNESSKSDAVEEYGGDNVERIQKGLAPQRYNSDKGGMESKELSHEPIPAREGGTEFVPKWPQEHAEYDPFRRPGY